MPVDHRPVQNGGNRRNWASDSVRMGSRASKARAWLLITIPLVALLAVAVLPVRGATFLPALRAGLSIDRWLAPQAITWSGFTPAGWVVVRPTNSSVTAEAPGGLDPVTAAYAVSTDAGNTWSAWSVANLTVTGVLSTTQTLDVAGLSFPDSGNANLMRFRIQEFGGALETSADFVVKMDTAQPASTVTQPAAGAVLNAVPAIAGTAADGSGSGVGQVSVSIRGNASGLYWNGASWVAGEQWLAATGTTGWSYGGPQPSWSSGGAYTVRSRATDVAGNAETPGAGIGFTFDATAPAVTLTAPNGGEIWAGGQPHTLTWTASDTVGLASAPITLSVSYDNGANWTLIAGSQANTGSYPWTPSATINSNQVLIQVEAQDLAGNRASDRSDAVFTIDSAPPAVPLNLTATPPAWTNNPSFNVAWTNPPDVSPVAGAWYKLDTPPVSDTDGTFVAGVGITSITGISPTNDGAHPVYVWLQDTLGRANHANAASTTLYLDRLPPGAPDSFIGTPARVWTNINSFAETWTNPDDPSGIVGAWYRLDAPGSSPTDGTFVSTTNTLTGIVVPSDGKHDLWIWLQDGAGNKSHLKRNVDLQVFWYDGTPPTSTLTVVLAPPHVVIGGTATDGSGSGVSQVSVSIRDSASGLYWNGVGWAGGEQWLAATGLATWSYAGPEPAWVDGSAYTVRSRTMDAAGNVEIPVAGYSFIYDTTPPAISLTAPNGGEIWAGGQTYTVTWIVTDTVGLPLTPITLSVSYDAGANWSVIASNLPNTGSYPWSPPGTVNTNHALMQAEVVDRGGNRVSDRSNAFFTIDSSPPTAPLNLTATPAVWTNVADFSVSWTNPPNVSPVAGAWYKLDAPPLTPHDGTYVTGTTTIAGLKPAVDGAHPIYVWLQDTLGRADHSAYAIAFLQLDRTPPGPPSDLVGSPARVWTNINSFAEIWTNPLDVSGIVGAYYRLDQPGLSPTDGDFVTTTNTLSGIVMPGDGKHDLYIWLRDAAGNFNHLNWSKDSQVFWYDGTPPTSTLVLNPPLPASGWYSTTVTVSFQGEDAPGGSGLANVPYRVDDGAWELTPTVQIATEGQHTIQYYARDVAGNSEKIVKEQQLALDLTPPLAVLTAARPPEASGWYTAPVTFSLAATDTLSGGPRPYYRLNGGAWQTGAQFGLISDGSYAIDYYGQDAAGNRSTVASAQARLDTTPPATAYLLEGSQGQNGWYTSRLTVKLIATDGGAGVATTYYRINAGPWQTGNQFQLSTDGYYVLEFYSVDSAGNVETSFPVQVKLDTAAPGAPTAVETIPATWSRVNRFSVQWATPTDLSGIAGVYYRLGEPTAPADGTFSAQTNRLDGLTVPGEGVHHVFLWLRDVAGNAEHRNRAEAPLLRYDATPPSTTATVQGMSGTDGWYRSPVTVTLRAVDLLSGVAWLRYRLDGGEWISASTAATVVTITTSDKHVLEFAAEDTAGNVEAIHEMTVRIDTDPPASPLALRAEPAGWQHWNSFRLQWTAPLDQSGIAGAYVKLAAPPAGPNDGVFYPGGETADGLSVPGEGKHSVYVWLRDRAGNTDHATAVALPDALWYDATPPVTVITRTGSVGQDGWDVGPVSFTMSATDAASDLASIRYQVDDGPWQTGDGGASGSFTVDIDGAHVVRISSTDIAGNEEAAHIFYVNIDRQAPSVLLGALHRYQAQPGFMVSWQGADPAPGSGLAAFDIQVRDGYQGDWRAWLTGTTATSATYTGQRGHTYFFRAAARDVAGNRQPFTAGDTYAAVETVQNGSFDTGNFTAWGAGGQLFEAVVPTVGPMGNTVLAARLGSEDYGPSLTVPGAVPVGNATITQTLRIPDASQYRRPMLRFWYRVLTYDVIYSERYQRLQDSLDVSIHNQAGNLLALVLRDGNSTQVFKQLYDTGWKSATLDLRPYAGQTVQLVFANWNRVDNLFNTWSYLDDIQVLDGALYSVYLPLLTGGGGGAASAASRPVESAAPAVQAPAVQAPAEPGAVPLPDATDEWER